MAHLTHADSTVSVSHIVWIHS